MGFLEGFGKKLGVLDYQGTWNAQTNTPTLSSSSGKKGQYYIVSVSGSTLLAGVSTWESGDWIIHNGSNWQKMDAADKEKTNQLETQINAEVTSRQAAVNTEATARSADDLTEKTRAIAAESTLQTAVSAEQTRATAAETSLQTAINTEITARQSADSSLQSQINVEITARQSADAAKVDSANAIADGYKISQAAFITKTSGYTLTSSENGKVILVNSASAVTITVPSGLSIGFSCSIVQLGAGQVTIAASGTTLNSVSGLKIVGQHGAASILSYDTNIFNVSGATTAW